MAISVEPFIVDQFKGIREYNGVASGGQISAIEAKNVELIPNDIGSSVGLKTMKGNINAYTLPEGFKVIEIFKSVQDGITYKFIYAESETVGRLYYVDITNSLQVIIDNLTVTGNANGLTMTSSAYDVFVFTNGVEAKTVCFTTDAGYGDSVKTITATDELNRNVHWLSMVEWNGFLVVASEYGVHSSHQNNIYKWNDNPDDIADSWHIDFSKKVTAVYAFTGGLYIFTATDTSYLNTTPNDTTNSKLELIAGVGCFSYTSLVKHDTYLYFYDNVQKNVYYIQNIDSGQMRPAGPIAKEIQSRFEDVKRFKMYSCIYSNWNQVWCIINDELYICDYAQGEWLQRDEQKLNSICLIGNSVYTGTDGRNVLLENVGNNFNGDFKAAVYQTTFINLGTDTNIKKQKTPLLLVLKRENNQDFWVELTVNSKAKTPKRINIRVDGARYIKAGDTEGARYNISHYPNKPKGAKTVIEISTPQTWYSIGIKIYTASLGQEFYIQSLELKNIKEKTKTRGR